MGLTRYGLREWIAMVLVATFIGALLAYAGSWWGLGALAVATLAMLSFFRDPWFRKPASDDPRDLVSPADGKISAVFTVPEHEATGGPALVVRIFLSVLDVHVNRSPCDATVVALKHRPGLFLDARTEESATRNESNLITLSVAVASGEARIGVKQISGAIARHIVCPIAPGDRLGRAERFGMIKFGSTTELIVPFPERSKALVKVGDRVKGGVTILVRADWLANA
jgi:phosphatidylserine decarboxylase